MSRWLTNKWESLKNWGLYAGRSSKEFMVEWNMYSVQTFRYIIIYAVFHVVKAHNAVARQKWFLIVRLRTVANK